MSRSREFYLKVGRLISPLAVLGLKLYTFVTKRPRVRVIVTNEHGEVLLLKSVVSLNHEWTFPGGGVNRHEPSADAASRELHEETGILLLPEQFTLVRRVEKAEFGLSYVAIVYVAACLRDDLPGELINPREIAAIRWADPRALPKRTARSVVMLIRETIESERG